MGGLASVTIPAMGVGSFLSFVCTAACLLCARCALLRPAGNYLPVSGAMAPSQAVNTRVNVVGRRLLETCTADQYSNAGVCKTCPALSTNPSSSEYFVSCECPTPKFLYASSVLFGLSGPQGTDTTDYGASPRVFIIRTPIFYQNQGFSTATIASWTVTTTRACTIQPFHGTAATDVWSGGTGGEVNYFVSGTSVPRTIPAAGTYTFPWEIATGGNVISGAQMKVLGWYYASGADANCISSTVGTGPQILRSWTTSNPKFNQDAYFGNYGGNNPSSSSIQLNYVPAATNILFGLSGNQGTDSTNYGSSPMVFIIRTPIFPQNYAQNTQTVVSWTVTTTRGCTIQPFFGTAGSDSWNAITSGEVNYYVDGASVARTVPEAGTYTFPWEISRGGNKIWGASMKVLGWYYASAADANCISSTVGVGYQVLRSWPARTPYYYSDSYFGNWASNIPSMSAIRLNFAPEPDVLECRGCDANYYKSSSTSCSPCPANSTSIAGSGSGSVNDCKCISGKFLSGGVCLTCPVGMVCAVSEDPLQCSQGSYCPSGSTAEIPCPAGSYCATPSTKVQCAENTYCPAGSTAPTACPDSKLSPSGSTSLAQCETNSVSVAFTVDGVDPAVNQSHFTGALPGNVAVNSFGEALLSAQSVCPVGFYCPADTTNPIACPANTFNSFTNRAEMCDQCPIFSTSPVASTNCTCDAGHYHVVTMTGGGGSSTQLLNVAVQDTVYDNLMPVSYKFLQTGGSSHTSVGKGSTVTFQSSAYGAGNSIVSLNVFSQLYNARNYYIAKYNIDESWGGTQYADVIPVSGSISHATQTSYIYSTGVSGQGTATLVWDTTEVPSNLYFLGTQAAVTGVNAPLSVFVASPTPCTITYSPIISYTTTTVMTAACLGDTLVLNKPTGHSSFDGSLDISVFCIDMNDQVSAMISDGATVMTSGPSPLTWVVAGIDDTKQCYISYGSDLNVYYSVLVVYPRPAPVASSVSTLTCANCSSGYRSSPGDQACTECGLGYYSSPVSETCTICPAGTKCPTATTPESVDCGVGYYQSQAGQSACLPCPAGKYCDLARTVTPTSCPAGTFRTTEGAVKLEDCVACPSGNYCPLESVTPTKCVAGSYRADAGAVEAGQCLACTTGHYCPVETTTPTNCVAGTYNPSASSDDPTDCLVCATGRYATDIARSEICPLCAANSYCPTPTTINACPENTVSTEGSSSMLDCRCVPGFSCTYTKQITAVVTLNATASSFNNDVGGVRTAFIAAIAAAAHVPVSAVHIGAVTGAGRRLLSLDAITVFATVSGATRLQNLGSHLAKHSPLLHLGHSWQEAHSIARVSTVQRPMIHSSR
jgi:hypothetical protein